VQEFGRRRESSSEREACKRWYTVTPRPALLLYLLKGESAMHSEKDSQRKILLSQHLLREKDFEGRLRGGFPVSENLSGQAASIGCDGIHSV
jgi:hypothetical protein